MQGKNQVNPSTLADDITSHELRNALCGIFGLVDLLESSGLNPVQQSLVAALKRSSRQMNWLMDAFVPRGDNIQFHSSARRVAANGIDLLEQLIQCHLVAAQDNSIRLLLVVDSGMPEDWRVDRYLLWLVLDNLLGNAIKYGGPGEVVLEARRQKATDSA